MGEGYHNGSVGLERDFHLQVRHVKTVSRNSSSSSSQYWPHPIDTSELMRVHTEYSSIPQACFRLASDPSYIAHCRHQLDAFIQSTSKAIDLDGASLSLSTSILSNAEGSTVSSYIFSVVPGPDRWPLAIFSTEKMAKEIADGLLIRNPRKYWEYLNWFLRRSDPVCLFKGDINGNDDAGQCAAWLWQTYIYKAIFGSSALSLPCHAIMLQPDPDSGASLDDKTEIIQLRLPLSKAIKFVDMRDLVDSFIRHITPEMDDIVCFCPDNETRVLIGVIAFSISRQSKITIYRPIISNRREIQHQNAGLNFILNSLRKAAVKSKNFVFRDLQPPRPKVPGIRKSNDSVDEKFIERFKWRVVLCVPASEASTWKMDRVLVLKKFWTHRVDLYVAGFEDKIDREKLVG